MGRGELGALLTKLEEKYGTEGSVQDNEPKLYDTIVIGGGPAGASAAIYSARKVIRVAVIAENVG